MKLGPGSNAICPDWPNRMKKSLAFFLTVAIVVGAFWISSRRVRREPEEPESVVWRMIEQSRVGNVRGYLECFEGATRLQLERNTRDMGEARFSEYLRENMAKIKGIAVYDLQKPGQDQATLVVEYVYQEKNERQRLSLKKERGTWWIVIAGASERIQPLVPYGKPVTDEQ